MKIGDLVDFPPLIASAIVGEVDGKYASIWWPCPEYGRHTKICLIDQLVIVDDKNSESRQGKKPVRLKDPILDNQLMIRT